MPLFPRPNDRLYTTPRASGPLAAADLQETNSCLVVCTPPFPSAPISRLPSRRRTRTTSGGATNNRQGEEETREGLIMISHHCCAGHSCSQHLDRTLLQNSYPLAFHRLLFLTVLKDYVKQTYPYPECRERNMCEQQPATASARLLRSARPVEDKCMPVHGSSSVVIDRMGVRLRWCSASSSVGSVYKQRRWRAV